MDVIETRPAFRRWWKMFKRHELTQIGFYYELAARLERSPNGSRRRDGTAGFQVRKTAVPVYPFGKPFCDLCDHEFGALADACSQFLERPKMGHEAAEPTTFVSGESTHVPFGRGSWTDLMEGVVIKGKTLRSFAVNLSRSNEDILADFHHKAIAVGTPPRSDTELKKLIKGWRVTYRATVASLKPTKGERRNFAPWAHVEALMVYQQGCGTDSRPKMPTTMRTKAVKAGIAYEKFLDDFEEDHNWETPWEIALKTPPHRAGDKCPA